MATTKTVEQAFHTGLPRCYTPTRYRPITKAPPLSTPEDGHIYKLIKWTPAQTYLDQARERYSALTTQDRSLRDAELPTLTLPELATAEDVGLMTEFNLIPGVKRLVEGSWLGGELTGRFTNGPWGEKLYVWTLRLAWGFSTDVAVLVIKPPNQVRGQDYFGVVGGERQRGGDNADADNKNDNDNTTTKNNPILTHGLQANAIPHTQQARKYGAEQGISHVALFDFQHLVLLDLDLDGDMRQKENPGDSDVMPDLLTVTYFDEQGRDLANGECFHMVLLGFVLSAMDRVPSLLQNQLKPGASETSAPHRVREA
ncbi:uncharacterized protein BO66DRAFT_435816 [Aspergillus aculeatinus CBS 121060]|uniref:Uncharacterized protein n=1 Tax=Aspergillus aculeatinus CBS 121060 TaxID=1448322 RepID=A0ACD1HHK1_9EURO|nr:hypothetical protein BO66DRAFT_435816 [Aspergillus aculeatinus CBS 121060]RAH72916.1 hypothetical protein BO66DRAFT_435816 [Aspergillus aculeatinus CBS 121060]